MEHRQRLDDELAITRRVPDGFIGMTAQQARAAVEAAGHHWAENCFTDDLHSNRVTVTVEDGLVSMAWGGLSASEAVRRAPAESVFRRSGSCAKRVSHQGAPNHHICVWEVMVMRTSADEQTGRELDIAQAMQTERPRDNPGQVCPIRPSAARPWTPAWGYRLMFAG